MEFRVSYKVIALFYCSYLAPFTKYVTFRGGPSTALRFVLIFVCLHTRKRWVGTKNLDFNVT